MDLLGFFQEINARHFDGFLEPPVLRWNGRLRTSSGRFFPGSKSGIFRKNAATRPPIIEVASYLLEEEQAEIHVRETIAHEMIHYWLWVRKRPHGHTDEFYSKMTQMGARRYNPVPRRRPFKYLYGCSHCESRFKSRRLLGKLACAKCCKSHGNGKYQERFRLVLLEKLAGPKPSSSTKAVLGALLAFGFFLPSGAQALGGSRGGGAPVRSIWVSAPDGSLQCEPVQADARAESLRTALVRERVEVLEWTHVPEGKSGRVRMALCGSPTGGVFRARIAESELGRAEAVGFKAE